MGPDLEVIDRLGLEVEAVMQGLPGTRSAFFERLIGGRYLDITVDRDRAARIGLSVGEVNDVVEAAIGGAEATTVVSGRERWSVLVRYPRDLRDDVEALGRVLVATPSGAQVPLSEIASLRLVSGPAMIRNEDGFLAGIVFVDVLSEDFGGYVKAAKSAVAASVELPPGYRVAWGGQWQYAERARLRLLAIVPLTLLLIVVLLWINTGSLAKTSIILLAVPFSAIGAVLLLWALDYNISVATWVGLIALLGVDAETGVFMLLYLDLAIDSARKEGRLQTAADLRAAIEEGAVRRLRPKVMTVTVMFAGLLPIMWSTGTGSDVMRRIAAPIIGGLVTSFLLELLVYPVIYDLWQGRKLRRG
jgi:Cu(I)/Ag(I) efflux system membrane protein CusA/SilA